MQEKISISKLLDTNKKFRFININPGFISDYGHHYNMNQMFYESIKKSEGDFIVLSNKKLYIKDKIDFTIFKTFTYDTWVINQANDVKLLDIFKKELYQVVNEIYSIDKKTNNFFFMYISDIIYIPYIMEILNNIDQDKNCFCINLFHLGKYISDNNFQNNIKIIFDLINNQFNKYNIKYFVETDSLKKLLLKDFNFLTKTLPMFYFTSNVGVIPKNNSINRTDSIKVLIPSISIDRGYHFILKLLEYIKVHKIFNIKFILKNRMTYRNINKDLNYKNDNIQIIDEILENDEYIKLFYDSDIILIPYKSDDFKYRTSGVLADAILTEKPIVTTKGTWLSENILKHQNGLIFCEDDIKECIDAIFKIYDDYNEIKVKCIKAKGKWLKTNNIEAFFNTVLDFNLKRKYKKNNINLLKFTTDIILDKKKYLIQNDEKITILKNLIQQKDEQIIKIYRSYKYKVGKVLLSPLYFLKIVYKNLKKNFFTFII